MAVCGTNNNFLYKQTHYSYYFSRYFSCWGWASWRRAWQHYDVDMKLFPKILDAGILNNILVKSREIRYWQRIFQNVYSNKTNTWDYQFVFACWLQSGLSIIPKSNLISNIGFGGEATHTTNKDSEYANSPSEPMTFPLNHPPYLVRNSEADNFKQEFVFNPSLVTRAKSKLKRLLGKSFLRKNVDS
jgi:hypothetical protein